VDPYQRLSSGLTLFVGAISFGVYAYTLSDAPVLKRPLASLADFTVGLFLHIVTMVQGTVYELFSESPLVILTL
jgi:hypothetical protein